MIKVNDYKTGKKIVHLMRYHKDWKVRKKNIKRYKNNMINLWNLGLRELLLLSKYDKLMFRDDISDLNITYGINNSKEFMFLAAKHVKKQYEKPVVMISNN